MLTREPVYGEGRLVPAEHPDFQASALGDGAGGVENLGPTAQILGIYMV